MLSLLFYVVKSGPQYDPCSEYNSSCLLCMDHRNDCFFCFGEKEADDKCVSNVALNETTCSHTTRQIDIKCIETLGGDAIQLNRYIIGSAVIAVAITIDLIVRFCSRPKVHDTYAHL